MPAVVRQHPFLCCQAATKAALRGTLRAWAVGCAGAAWGQSPGPLLPNGGSVLNLVLLGVLLLAALLALVQLGARHRRSQKQLQKQDQTLQQQFQMLEGAVVAFKLFDQQGELLWCNATAHQLLERLNGQASQLNLFKEPRYLEEGLHQIAKRVLETGERLQSPYLFRHGDGTFLYLRHTVDVLTVGTTRYLPLQTENLTEQHALRAEVDTERQRLTHLIESMGAGTMEVDWTQRRVSWSDDWSLRLGLNSVGTNGLSFEQFFSQIHPEDLPALRQAFNLLEVGQKEHLELEYRIQNSSGTWRWVRGQGQVSDTSNGSRGRLLKGVQIDIHQSKQREKTLERTQQLLVNEQKLHQRENLQIQQIKFGRENAQRQVRELIDSQASAVALLDRQSRVVLCNEPYAGQWRMRVSEVQNEIATRFYPPEVAQTLQTLIDRVLQGESVQHEIKLTPRWPDEQLRVQSLHFTPRFDAEHQVVGYILCINDITGLVQAREQAQQGEASKQRFISVISHEMRTPLNAVLGGLELLKDEVASESGRRSLEWTRRSGQMLLDISNDVLDLAMIEAGKLLLSPRPTRLVELLDQVGAVLGTLPRPATVELTTERSPGLDELVLVDDLRLRQVLINLGNNALKFTQQGEVRLRARCMRTTPAALGVYFAIVDSGSGMPPDQVERLFTPFNHQDAAHTRRFGGSGLGLSIAQQLVRQMGGQIEVHSEVGWGSVFSFELNLPRLRDDTH